MGFEGKTTEKQRKLLIFNDKPINKHINEKAPWTALH